MDSQKSVLAVQIRTLRGILLTHEPGEGESPTVRRAGHTAGSHQEPDEGREAVTYPGIYHALHSAERL